MKKNILFLGLMLGALCLAGCNKEDLAPVNSGRTLTINAASDFEEDADTKTSMSEVGGVYKPSWVAGDVLGLYTSVAGNSNVALTLAASDIASGNVATFHGTIAAAAATEDYTFYTYYPKSAFNKSDGVSNIKLVIPTNQRPTATSFDPAADILLSKPVTQSINKNATNANLTLRFKRTTSVIKFTFSDFDGVAGTEKINKLTLTLNEAEPSNFNYLTGRVKVNLEASTMESYYSQGYGFDNAIALYSVDNAPALSSANVFLVVNPFELKSTDSLTVRIDTDSHIITKTLTSSETKNFLAREVTPINLKLDKDLANCTIEAQEAVVLKSISDVRALGITANISQSWKIRGVVMSDRIANMNNKSIVLQDGTGINSGITVRTSAIHSYNLGDDLEVVITGGTISEYNKLLQITPSSDADIVKKGENADLYPAQVITVPQLKTGNYESMYVQIDNVQAVAAHIGQSMNDANNYGKVTMQTTSDSFLMYTNSNSSFKEEAVPDKSGSLRGIAYIFNTDYQVLPQGDEDFQGWTGARFVTLGKPVLSGSMIAGVALSGCRITIPVYDNTSPVTYQVSVTASGAGSAGITSPFTTRNITTNSDDELVIPLSGTPTASGDVVFSVTIKDAAGTKTLKIMTVNATVTSSDETVVGIDFSVGSSYPAGFPNAKDSTLTMEQTDYVFGGYTFSFFSQTGNGYYKLSGHAYLMLGKKDSYILLPAISDKKLTKVEITSNKDASTYVKVGIKTSDGSSFVTGGEAIVFNSTDYKFVYNLTGTANNTRYRIHVTTANNCQINYLKLTYSK